MRIIFVASQFYPHVGGCEIQALKLAQALLGLGHSVRVYTIWQRRLSISTYLDNLKILRLGFPFFGFIKEIIFCLDLSIRLLFTKSKVIHFHGFHNHILSAIPILLLRSNVSVICKLVSSLQENDLIIFKNKSLLHRYLLPFLIRHLTYIVVTTPCMKKEVLGLGVDKSKIAFIPNGVKINPKESTKKSQKIKFVYFGRLAKTKNVSFLLDVFSMLDLDVTLDLIGNGPEYHNLVAKVANSYILQNKIQFLGEIDPTLLPQLLDGYDYYLSSSYIEGLSNSLLESIANNLIPIVSDIESNKYVLGFNALSGLCLPLEPEIWVSTIRQLVFNAELNIEIRSQLKQRISEFSIDQISNQYVALYSGEG